ncbi:MAG: hypothetical protein L6R38_001625 [Xanthoria sp. 2 TBL-2021]|nr:MAG: hypothetical protein L6R38_001625 [Xanthoria sp. 2 TBL-2021]
MAPLKVLICGGGCAGTSVAFWLARSGHHVTIVERFPALRASGAQIDIRGQGIQVLKRMGLLETIRSKLVDEAGVSLVDSQGNIKATILANKSGQGAQSLTSEYEIMRVDLIRVLYDATKDDVEYIFGKTVESFDQDQNEKDVIVHFSDGQTSRYDMLVGADGQGSHIRKAILPSHADPVKRLGLYLAYWFVPRAETDNNIRKVYHVPSGMVMSRTHSLTEGQAYFGLRDDSSNELRSLPRASTEAQKEFWSQRFRGAGWQTDRLIDGMQTDDFYCQEVVQIHTDTWSKGRVVLLGDAVYCPSPITGMGTTGAFVGAYVLAGEINRNSQDLPLAFANYDKTLRPFVDKIQKFNPTLLRLGYPNTQWGITVLHLIAGPLSFRIPYLIARFSPAEKAGWRLPDYPELKYAV